jgi:hypothetical protein
MRLGVWGVQTKNKTYNFLKKRIIVLPVAVRQQQHRLSVFELEFQLTFASNSHVESKGNIRINITTTLMQ